MEIEVLTRLQGKKYRAWADLLENSGLDIQFEPETTVLVWDGDTLVATGSRKENLLGCIAVAPDRQGEGLTATVVTSLRKDAFQTGHHHLFVYTKPANREMFTSLFFYPVAQTNRVVLLESVSNGIGSFLWGLPSPCVSGRVGAVVMNCNPFTRGHRYLIETAAKECDWVYVFILSEDKSRFSAKDRLEMAKLATADISNVTVLPTGPYLISSATFPSYFLKGENTGPIQCRLDIDVFVRHFAPRFNIQCRYVGTEPASPVTNQYNQVLKAELPRHGIELRELERITHENEVVSASAVRSLLDMGETDAIRGMIPRTTYEYLQANGLLHKGG